MIILNEPRRNGSSSFHPLKCPKVDLSAIIDRTWESQIHSNGRLPPATRSKDNVVHVQFECNLSTTSDMLYVHWTVLATKRSMQDLYSPVQEQRAGRH